MNSLLSIYYLIVAIQYRVKTERRKLNYNKKFIEWYLSVAEVLSLVGSLPEPTLCLEP